MQAKSSGELPWLDAIEWTRAEAGRPFADERGGIQSPKTTWAGLTAGNGGRGNLTTVSRALHNNHEEVLMAAVEHSPLRDQ